MRTLAPQNAAAQTMPCSAGMVAPPSGLRIGGRKSSLVHAQCRAVMMATVGHCERIVAARDDGDATGSRFAEAGMGARKTV